MLSAALITTASASALYRIVLFLIGSPKIDVDGIEPPGYVLVPVAWVSLVTLGWIAFAAGVDLWRMRIRGRKLTLIAMSLILTFGALLAAMEFRLTGRVIGIALSLGGVFSIAYLLLPGVRSQFHE